MARVFNGVTAACLFVALLVKVDGAAAQSTTLPQPSRTVYKCVVAGKTVYTDDPCVGAQRVIVEPTRGMNKSSGRELTGADVRREKQNEAFAEAVKPITGKTPKEMEVQRKRVYFSAQTKAECESLDSSISGNEAKERGATSVESRAQIQRDLFALRKRHRDLRC